LPCTGKLHASIALGCLGRADFAAGCVQQQFEEFEQSLRPKTLSQFALFTQSTHL